MSVKSTGAEWKRFYSDPTIWPENAWHEEEEILINGSPRDEDFDLGNLLDSDVIVLSGGFMCYESSNNTPSLETVFKKWKKAQSVTTVVCEISIDKVELLKTAIIAAGGKVLQ